MRAIRCADARMQIGAGSGNRTRATSLEGWGSTSELYPPLANTPLHATTQVVEGGGFEPPKLTRQIYSLIPLATREPLPNQSPNRALSADGSHRGRHFSANVLRVQTFHRDFPRRSIRGFGRQNQAIGKARPGLAEPAQAAPRRRCCPGAHIPWLPARH